MAVSDLYQFQNLSTRNIPDQGRRLVFSQDDFKGFKKIGEGSKAQDTETSGMFGRGSQTMYHWTDSPMILSGGFLIILE